MSAVEFQDVKKVFTDARTGKQVTAVHNFSLKISSGQLVTLLGPSGCGKTTVLRILAGFETPTTGKVFLNGSDITDLAPNQRNSAMVFQSYALFPHMTVLENIAYGLKLRGIKGQERQKRLDRIFEVVNLRGYEERRPNELSGGQQQRVALARALVVEPAILLFGEPLSNLDAKLRESMRNEIREVQQKLKITAVYVTHDQAEAMAISDQVVVMSQGRIEQVGKPVDVYFRPSSVFVADFMGAANFLSGEVLETTAAGIRVRVHDEVVQLPKSANEKMVSGDKVRLVVRPETIKLGLERGLEARVEDHHFLGSVHEYHLRLIASDEKLIARPNARFGETPFQQGDKVRIAFSENNLHVLPKEKVSRVDQASAA